MIRFSRAMQTGVSAYLVRTATSGRRPGNTTADEADKSFSSTRGRTLQNKMLRKERCIPPKLLGDHYGDTIAKQGAYVQEVPEAHTR